jgi:hypothetical protein
VALLLAVGGTLFAFGLGLIHTYLLGNFSRVARQIGYLRHRIVGDLVDSGRLQGMSLAEVTALLGAPDQHDERAAFELGSTECSCERGGPAVLQVHFDAAVAVNAWVGHGDLACRDASRTLPFERERWSGDESGRWQMAKELSLSRALLGKTERELTHQLGSPSASARAIQFALGWSDAEELQIVFDAADIVADAEVVSDDFCWLVP